MNSQMLSIFFALNHSYLHYFSEEVLWIVVSPFHRHLQVTGVVSGTSKTGTQDFELRSYTK